MIPNAGRILTSFHCVIINCKECQFNGKFPSCASIEYLNWITDQQQIFKWDSKAEKDRMSLYSTPNSMNVTKGLLSLPDFWWFRLSISDIEKYLFALQKTHIVIVAILYMQDYGINCTRNSSLIQVKTWSLPLLTFISNDYGLF